MLYQHVDGRFGIAPAPELATFTRGDPGWHRVGPVDVVVPADEQHRDILGPAGRDLQAKLAITATFEIEPLAKQLRRLSDQISDAGEGSNAAYEAHHVLRALGRRIRELNSAVMQLLGENLPPETVAELSDVIHDEEAAAAEGESV